MYATIEEYSQEYFLLDLTQQKKNIQPGPEKNRMIQYFFDVRNLAWKSSI